MKRTHTDKSESIRSTAEKAAKICEREANALIKLGRRAYNNGDMGLFIAHTSREAALRGAAHAIRTELGSE